MMYEPVPLTVLDRNQASVAVVVWTGMQCTYQ